jgi:metal-dependent amidase/aminoacylase/carboxypeptidase family protein
MIPISEILMKLSDFSAQVVAKPAVYSAGGFGVRESFAQIAAEVRHADARPAEGVRTTNAAVIMVIALEQYFQGDREPTSPWLMLAGTTLPLLRAEAWVAHRNEKEARGQS